MGSDISPKSSQWKTRVYLIGVAGGALFGLVSALLYSRAAEEEAEKGGKPPQIPTGTIIGLLLSALALTRQIAEAGKPRK
jgi:H+/Cl- antiporter ClcA